MLLHDPSSNQPAALNGRRFLLFSLLACAAASTGLAQTEGEKGLHLVLPDSTRQQLSGFVSLAKFGLVIGINEYQNREQGITPLRYAVGDARAIYQTLIDPRRGGFSPDNVTLLTDDTPEKPTNTAIGKALNRLATATKEGDLVLVFFSGHGYEDQGRSYLLPTNADLDALDYSAIERDAFVRQIDRIAAKKVIVILDACHSGGVSRGGKGAGKDLALSGRYYESFAGSQGRAFIASSGGGELSWEDESRGHGVFTSALVDALSGQADKQPADGLVSLNEMRTYVEDQVSDWASRRGKSQHPQVNLESAHGDMPIALHYAYLESQSRGLAEQRDQAASLKSGLATIQGLEPAELAQALAVVDRYGQGLPLSEADAQSLEFTKKLVDGSIDVKMYRAGVAKSALTLSPGQTSPQKKTAWWSNKWLIGGVAVVAAGTAVAASGGGGSGGSTSTTASSLPSPPPPPGP